MRWIPRYTEDAREDLARMNRTTSDRIIAKVDVYCDSGKPLAFAKRLHGELADYYRFRIGEHRVIFQRVSSGEVQILSIIRVAFRRDAYDA